MVGSAILQMNSYQTTGAGARRHLKSTFKNMFLLVSLQCNNYKFSGLGVGGVWKLFNKLMAHKRTSFGPNFPGSCLCFWDFAPQKSDPHRVKPISVQDVSTQSNCIFQKTTLGELARFTRNHFFWAYGLHSKSHSALVAL